MPLELNGLQDRYHLPNICHMRPYTINSTYSERRRPLNRAPSPPSPTPFVEREESKKNYNKSFRESLATVERTGKLLPGFKGYFYGESTPAEQKRFNGVWPVVCQAVDAIEEDNRPFVTPFLTQLLTESSTNFLLGRPDNSTFPLGHQRHDDLHKFESSCYTSADERLALLLVLLLQRFGYVGKLPVVYSTYFKRLGGYLEYSTDKLATVLRRQQDCLEFVKMLRDDDNELRRCFQDELNNLIYQVRSDYEATILRTYKSQFVPNELGLEDIRRLLAHDYGNDTAKWRCQVAYISWLLAEHDKPNKRVHAKMVPRSTIKTFPDGPLGWHNLYQAILSQTFNMNPHHAKNILNRLGHPGGERLLDLANIYLQSFDLTLDTFILGSHRLTPAIFDRTVEHLTTIFPLPLMQAIENEIPNAFQDYKRLPDAIAVAQRLATQSGHFDDTTLIRNGLSIGTPVNIFTSYGGVVSWAHLFPDPNSENVESAYQPICFDRERHGNAYSHGRRLRSFLFGTVSGVEQPPQGIGKLNATGSSPLSKKWKSFDETKFKKRSSIVDPRYSSYKKPKTYN
ncbi:hypothetical protein TRVA0_031S01838 [Trichomonascus vanleenenianus]|uniref:uncharacterized protein n=1 Tax=Trichomonascus vanleenenianus TaxID=2268995 RepID=UPI003ECB3644